MNSNLETSNNEFLQVKSSTLSEYLDHVLEFFSKALRNRLMKSQSGNIAPSVSFRTWIYRTRKFVSHRRNIFHRWLIVSRLFPVQSEGRYAIERDVSRKRSARRYNRHRSLVCNNNSTRHSCRYGNGLWVAARSQSQRSVTLRSRF